MGKYDQLGVAILVTPAKGRRPSARENRNQVTGGGGRRRPDVRAIREQARARGEEARQRPQAMDGWGAPARALEPRSSIGQSTVQRASVDTSLMKKRLPPMVGCAHVALFATS